MRLDVPFKRHGALFGGACALLALAACSDGSAGPAAGAALPAPAAASAKSYYLVTQMRPADLGKLFRRERGAHELCAVEAKLKGIPVKPFPALPADFVLARSMYASDGRQTFVKELKFKIEDAPVETGCAYKVASYATSSIARDGKARVTEQDEAGALSTGAEMPDSTEPVSPSKLAAYTEARTIHGVQLKCKGSSCIVDPALALIGRGRRPVLAASRIDDESLFGTALVTEPVSLTVGKPLDLAEFKQEAGK